MTGNYSEGLKHGKFIHYDLLNPELALREEQYKNGQQHGTWTTRYKYGNTESIKNFSNGMRHGTIKYYDENGKTIYEAQYKNDKLVKKITDQKETGKSK